MDMKRHSIKEYVALLSDKGLIEETNFSRGENERAVGHISFDSSDIGPDTLFVCKGAHFSVDYLSEALSKGAFVYVSETVHATAPYIIVNDVRKAMAYIADMFYGRVSEDLKLVGITGTKGKSTTSYYLKYIFDDYLKSMGKPKSAILSSIDNYDGVIDEESHLTTPEAFVLHRHFKNAVESGIEFLTMEVSSQGLKYNRTLGVVFDVGCFLNIDEDHISGIEHSDFEDYLSSKLLLFDQCKTVCVNLGSAHIERILGRARERAPKVITFGFHETAEVYGYDISVNQSGISFKARTGSFDREFELTMPGLFNVENALAAIAACCALGIPENHIFNGLKRARASGRMEVFRGGGIDVIVDYAHNKMSFEALFASTLKEFPGKKIFIVFGCPGYKALGRRRELGEIAGKHAEMAFITEEDAGEEPVMDICLEIARHIEKQGCRYEIIPDRGEAIERAIGLADGDTVILITGKGRETRQKRGLKYVETPSDVEYTEKFLAPHTL